MTWQKKNDDYNLTSLLNGFSTGNTSCSAMHWSTRGGPIKPPNDEDNDATNKPNMSKPPTTDT